MSLMGRQIPRSNATANQQQRQYTDNFLDAPIWQQSTSSLDFGISGGGAQAQVPRNTRKSPDPMDMNQLLSSSSIMKKNNGHDYIAATGLLDLNSFDTDLLTETEVPGLYDPRGNYSDDSEAFLALDKATNKTKGLPDNNILKNSSTEKERANNVAKIKVVVRTRPLNKKEFAKKEEDIITVEENSKRLTVHETKLKVDLTEYIEKHEFVFDAVLNANVSNDDLYSETVKPIVPLIFNRTKATCFAYGQTGSGKTYTMQPLPLRASQDILTLMHYTYRNQGFQLFVSFFEIYGGKVFDLLNSRKKLCMREDGKQQVCIVGLQEYKVSDVKIIQELIEKGNATRSTGTTGANEESSRSHAILQLAIKRSADGSESKPARLVGKLSFIDLAGSERGADTTDNDKQTRMESAEINKSLLALKECIRALDNDQGHVPFRGSKLTEVLRDSFVGDSCTVMISCISPSSGSCEHTLNTLRYADRVKSLSKGSSKRDQLSSSSNLRESTALPTTLALRTEPSLEDDIIDFSSEKNRFGWSKRIERETSPPIPVGRVNSGRIERNMATMLQPDRYKTEQIETVEDDFDYPEEVYEQDDPSSMNYNRGETYTVSKTDAVMKLSDADDDLQALLQEEADLVSAHRNQLEETVGLVTEEMNMLLEADQPGSQLDDYISRLDAILTRKISGLRHLQTRLFKFRRHLNEFHGSVPSGD